jgi:hypothetical protein
VVVELWTDRNSSFDGDISARWWNVANDHLHQGCLSGTIRPEGAEERTLSDTE